MQPWKSILKIGIFPKIIFGAQQAQEIVDFDEKVCFLVLGEKLVFLGVFRIPGFRDPPIDHFLIKVMSVGLTIS